MRLTADLFRWGLAVLLMVPFLAIPGWLMGLAPLLWLALAAIIVGGALNAAAVVRGVRRVTDGRVVDDLFGSVDARGGDPAPLQPRQRLIFPEGEHPAALAPGDADARRRLGAGLPLALLALTAFGAWTLAVEQPLAIAQGRLTLEETYAAWNDVSQTAFFVALSIWALVAIALAAALFVVSRLDGPVLGRVMTPRRFGALAAIAGSITVTAAFAPYFAVGISLPDDLSFMAGGVASLASTAFGLSGIVLSCVAIALTVPRWGQRAPR